MLLESFIYIYKYACCIQIIIPIKIGSGLACFVQGWDLWRPLAPRCGSASHHPDITINEKIGRYTLLAFIVLLVTPVTDNS